MTSTVGERPLLSRARLSGLLLRVPCDRTRIEAMLGRFGRLRLAPDPECLPDLCPVHCELWSVSDGAVRFGHLDQHQVAERLGAAWGGAAGALWGAALGPWAVARPRTALAERFAAASALAMSRAGASMLGTYSEVMVSLPGVIADDRGHGLAHTLVLGMVTDSALARWADIALGFGYDKRPGTFEKDTHGGWAVSSREGRHLLSVRRRTEATRPAASMVRRIDAAFQQPLLGRSARGGLVTSWLRRTLAQPDARVAQVGVLVEASRHFLAGLLPERGDLPPHDSDHGLWGGIEFSNLDAEVSYPSPA